MKISQKFSSIARKIVLFCTFMTKREGLLKFSSNPLETSDEVKIGSKTYIIERHFVGTRDIRKAVFEAAKNEAKRQNMT